MKGQEGRPRAGAMQSISKAFSGGRRSRPLGSVKVGNPHGRSAHGLRFNFSVAVVAGENGMGKSAILKAVVRAYEDKSFKKSFYPIRRITGLFHVFSASPISGTVYLTARHAI